MTDRVVSVEGVWKKFAPELGRSLAYGMLDLAGELLPLCARDAQLREGEFWALRDVSFELARGEALAIMGHNGAGKSTLLRVLHGILKPDRGQVRVSGRAEAVIELGTGFHPLLTGRENIELGAALQGLGPRETRNLVEEVVEFADIRSFIDAPLQSYSSGMKTRLAFGLSAHLGADLLLIDEVLAVGDFTFQRKCVNLMKDYLRNGGSLIFISHNVFQIQTICDRGVLLDRGRHLFTGSAVEVINMMLAMRPAEPAPASPPVNSDGPVKIRSVECLPVKGDRLAHGQQARIKLAYEVSRPIKVLWGFSIWTQDQWVCIAGEQSQEALTIGPGCGTLNCLVQNVSLVGGRYLLRGAILDCETKQPLALHGFRDAPTPFEVSEVADYMSNIKMTLHQLVHVDVAWEEPSNLSPVQES
jgi:ABC-type polysaccharide/polyol phosphate transport system ATPase subunit